jgi:hypothetical protein
VRLGEAARSIIIKKGTAVGVKTGKKKYGGKTVVFAMPLFHLFSLAGAGHFGADFVSYVKKIEPSRGLSIDFVFDRPVTDIRGGILGIDLPLWVKFQTGIDPTVAPAGRHVNTWGLLFDRGAPLNRETVKRTEAKIKKIMEEVMPGALKRVVRERKLVIPVINGNVLMPSQSYRFRPDVASRDVENLFFVGDTVKAEGCSGDIAFSSAMKMVDLLGERGL